MTTVDAVSWIGAVVVVAAVLVVAFVALEWWRNRRGR